MSSNRETLTTCRTLRDIQPKVAVTTPTGTSNGADTVRDALKTLIDDDTVATLKPAATSDSDISNNPPGTRALRTQGPDLFAAELAHLTDKDTDTLRPQASIIAPVVHLELVAAQAMPSIHIPTPEEIAAEEQRNLRDAQEAERQRLRHKDLTEILLFLSAQGQPKSGLRSWLDKTLVSVSAKKDLFSLIRSKYTQFSDQELRAIIANHQVVREKENLRRALITGGEDLEGEDGTHAIVYTLKPLNAGALGQVMDTYTLLNDEFVEAVLKIPLQDPSVDTETAYKGEVYNARKISEWVLPHVMRPLFISKSNEMGLSKIIYQRVSTEDGRCVNLEQFALDPRIPPSKKLEAFTYGMEGIGNMHTEGICHGDVKPHNLMLDSQNKATVVDFGTCTFRGEHIDFDLLSVPARNYKWVDWGDGKGMEWKFVGYSPYFTDLALLKTALAQGNDVRVGDRRALGISMIRILGLAGVLQLPPDEAAVFSPDFNFLEKFPPLLTFPHNTIPPSLSYILAIAKELIDIGSGKPLRPLHFLAGEIRRVLPVFQNEVDIAWKASRH